MRPPSIRAERVLVAGFDGGTFDALLPLAEAGVMPNLAALLREAISAPLRSTLPAITPTAWATFLTGADPDVHGVWDYRYFDPASRRTRLADASRLPIPTLLDAISQQDAEAVSIDLPMTWPISPAWRGLVLSGLGTPSTAAAFGPQQQFRQRVAQAGISYSLDPIWRRRPQTWDELACYLRRTEAAFRARTAVAALADRYCDWRLMIVQFQHLDGLQHRTWHLLGPPISNPAEPAWCHRVRHAYRTLDDCLGRLLELAAARHAAVLVLSDHGFGPFAGQIVMPELLARGGLLAFSSLGSRIFQAGTRIGWRLRKFLRRHVSRTSTAHLPRPVSVVANVDWRRTAALTLHGNLAALIYLNTPERFGTRTLAAPRLREQARQDTLGTLQEARHPTTGQCLFVEIFEPAATTRDEASRGDLPDLVAIPAPGFHVRHKAHPGSQLIRQEPMLTGTHRREGMLLCQVPGLSRRCLHSAELRDLAPSILRLLNMQPPTTMQGQALFDTPYTDQRTTDAPPATQARAAPPLPPAGRTNACSTPGPARTNGAALTEREEAVILDRLRDLGYVD
ncbi:MAG: alkaline phosphatase family protein [Pirellulales bacterium]|nr:alkaline phosphatase family protein [Pirellulales bacterium]